MRGISRTGHYVHPKPFAIAHCMYNRASIDVSTILFKNIGRASFK